MTLLELVVIIGLAAFRCARLIGSDVLLDRPRHWLFLRFPPKEPDYYRKVHRSPDGSWQMMPATQKRPATWLGKLIECPWCSSVWFAAGITAALSYWWSVPLPVLAWGAACSVAGICATITS